MPNYDFRKDLPIAQKTEKQVAVFLEKRFSGLKFVRDCDNSDYDLEFDLQGSSLTVEVKEDFTCKKTGNVGVEFSCRGKDSGIRVSKAHYYLYKVHRPDGDVSVYWIKTKDLKTMVQEEKYFRIVSGGDPGSNSMCYLFKLNEIERNFKYLGDV